MKNFTHCSSKINGRLCDCLMDYSRLHETTGAGSCPIFGSLQSLDWNGGIKWWNGIVECVLRSLLLQFVCFFFKKVTVEGLINSVCNQGPEGPELLL